MSLVDVSGRFAVIRRGKPGLTPGIFSRKTCVSTDEWQEATFPTLEEAEDYAQVVTDLRMALVVVVDLKNGLPISSQ